MLGVIVVCTFCCKVLIILQHVCETVYIVRPRLSSRRSKTGVSSGYIDSATKRSNKVISYDEAINTRPPLRIDMEGPTACTYTPITKPLGETNSPAWSFGRRTFVERGRFHTDSEMVYLEPIMMLYKIVMMSACFTYS